MINSLKNYYHNSKFKLEIIAFLYVFILYSPILLLTLNNYSFGLVWDWFLPDHSFVINKLNESLSSIQRLSNSGTIIGYNFELYYWLSLYILSIFFGKYYFFIFLIAISYLNIIYFLKLAPSSSKNLLTFCLIIFYSQNYFFISRFMAGHIPFLLIFNFLPLFIYCIQNLYLSNGPRIIDKFSIFLSFLSLVFFSNLTGISFYYFFLVSFLLINLNNPRLIFNILFIIFFSFMINLHIFGYLIFSFFDTSLIGSHNINNILETTEIRVNEQTIKKSFSWFELPFLNLKNSMFYEIMSNRPYVLRIINSLLLFFIICYTFFKIYLVHAITKKIKLYLILIFFSIIIITGFDNLIISGLYYTKLKDFFILYSNPLRYYSIFPFLILLILIHLHDKYQFQLLKNQKFIYFLILILTINLISDLFIYKNNFSQRDHTQTEKIQYMKNIPNDRAVSLLIESDNDHNILMIPPFRVGFPLKPNSPLNWKIFSYGKANLFIDNNSELSRSVIDQLIGEFDRDFFLNLLYENSVRYIIYPNSEKTLFYGLGENFDQSDFEKKDLEGLFDVSEAIDSNLNLIEDLLIVNNLNYKIYEIDYLPRVYGVSDKNEVNKLNFKHILNGLYFINNFQSSRFLKIYLNDNFQSGYFLVHINDFKEISTWMSVFKNKIQSKEENNKNIFQLNNNSKYFIIFNKHLIFYTCFLFISILFILFLLIFYIKREKK